MTSEATIPGRRRRSVSSASIKSRITPPLSTPDSWVAFEHALARAISDLDEDEFLVIERKDTNYFVQFAAQGSWGLRVEASANAYQPRAGQIPESAILQLMHIGWKPPTYVQTHEHSEPVDGSPNFYLDVAAGFSFQDISALAVETLRGPLGARHPAELQYEGYSEQLTSIRFPQLGIKRRVSILRSAVADPLQEPTSTQLQFIVPAPPTVC